MHHSIDITAVQPGLSQRMEATSLPRGHFKHLPVIARLKIDHLMIVHREGSETQVYLEDDAGEGGWVDFSGRVQAEVSNRRVIWQIPLSGRQATIAGARQVAYLLTLVPMAVYGPGTGKMVPAKDLPATEEAIVQKLDWLARAD